jgi:hypothetical protein
MKRLALLAIAFFLASPALADGTNRPRHTKRIYVERHAPVAAHRCLCAPTAMYDNYDTSPFRSYVWRPLPRRLTHPCPPDRSWWRRGHIFR